MPTTVSQLLDDLAAGRVTVDEVAAQFAARIWPDPPPASTAQQWDVADDDGPDPDSWAAVNADSRLNTDQYTVLADAYRQARRGGSQPGQAEGGGRGLVVAAAQTHTGAMVALVPTGEDAARLGADGGEDPNQLHLTLAYLGDAADIPPDRRQQVVDGMRHLAGLGEVQADGFAVSAFNPGDINDRDPCVVLGLTGDDLEDMHDVVEDVLYAIPGLRLPGQHSPWHPHVTLVYTADLSTVERLADRVGPVVFDRLRVAFAGEHVDIPLGPDGDLDDDEEIEPWRAAYIDWLDSFDCGCR